MANGNLNFVRVLLGQSIVRLRWLLRFAEPVLHESRRKLRLRATLRTYHIAVVGATGAVGTELIRVLERRGFPVATLRAIGSERSRGKTVSFCQQTIPV